MPKTQKKSYECGFKNTVIESPDFFKLLKLNGLTWTNRKVENNAFVWGFGDGYVVTTINPLTGEHRIGGGTRTTIGFAGEVGVSGTKAFRDRVAKFLKRNAEFKSYDPKMRSFI